MSVDLVVEPPRAEWADRRLSPWDELVARTPGSDVTQLSVWARVRAREGFRPVHLFVRDGTRLLGGAQVLARQVRGLGEIGYLSYGPVVAEDVADRGEVAERLAGALVDLPMRMLFVQPPEGGDEVREALLRHGFRPSAAGIAPTGSVRLDLHQREEEILRGLPPRLRSWTRRWADKGVRVRRGDERDLPTLARLMHATATTRGYQEPPSLDHLRHLYGELDRSGNAAIFIGEVHGEPVTADVVTMCGDMVRGRLSGFNRCGEAGRLSVPGAARWEIIRWAKQAGYRWLDFGGLSEETLADAVDRGVRLCQTWPGPDRAKMQYGGQPYRYPGPVEIIRPAALRVAYDAVAASERGRSVLHRIKVALRSRRVSGGVHLPTGRAAARPRVPRTREERAW